MHSYDVIIAGGGMDFVVPDVEHFPSQFGQDAMPSELDPMTQQMGAQSVEGPL